MKTGDEVARVVGEWEKSKGVKTECINCGHKAWDVHSKFGYNKIDCADDRFTCPVIIVCCKNCAYVKMYGAIQLGTVEKNWRDLSFKGDKNESQ